MADTEVIKRLIAVAIKPNMSEKELEIFAKELNRYDYYSVIVDEYYIEKALKLFKKKKVGLIVSYPFGEMSKKTKLKLAGIAVNRGCSEINLCPNYTDIKSGNFDLVKQELQEICREVNNRLDIVGVAQVGLMTLGELKKICDIFLEVEIHIIKTNACLSLGKSEVEHIKYIRRLYGNKIEIEVSGGVRNLDQAKAFIEAGADRIHSSTWKQAIGTQV